MTDAEKEKARAEAELVAELRRAQDDDDMRSIMSTPSGRRFIWRLLDRGAGVFRPSFAGADVQATAHNEGQRAVGLALMAELQRVSRDAYVQMVSEQVAALPPVVVAKDGEE